MTVARLQHPRDMSCGTELGLTAIVHPTRTGISGTLPDWLIAASEHDWSFLTSDVAPVLRRIFTATIIEKKPFVTPCYKRL